MSSVTLESFTVRNPNPRQSTTTTTTTTLLSNRASSIRYLYHSKPHRVSISAPKCLGLGLLPLHRHRFGNRSSSLFSFAASHEDSNTSEIEVEKEKNDLQVGTEESLEEWKQALASFKEQALKMQNVSQEAYELFSEKAMVVLKETSEKLKIQAEKARTDLSEVAKEISKEGKEYLCTAAGKSPEPLKDIVETFASSTDDIKEISEVRDFYLGIPYGILLLFSGFLSFMLTGSISAIRFGVILGGTLLALSISSLRSWKKGESVSLALKGQAAIASILFAREISLLFARPSFAGCFTALLSGAMAVFYVYRITLNGGQTNASDFGHGCEK